MDVIRISEDELKQYKTSGNIDCDVGYGQAVSYLHQKLKKTQLITLELGTSSAMIVGFRAYNEGIFKKIIFSDLDPSSVSQGERLVEHRFKENGEYLQMDAFDLTSSLNKF